MNAVKRTIVELLLLGTLSAVLAFGFNQVRGTRSIKIGKNYFAKSAQANPNNGNPDRPPPATRNQAAVSITPATPPSPPVRKLEHDYQEIDFEQLVEVFHDAATRQGLNVFVDARKDEYYQEGHIPGALHCDPYEVEKSIDGVLARTNGVERVIVYCGGGDCEDSIFMCRELVEAGVPQESLFLYPGGWTEWSARNMPAEDGHVEP